MLIRTIVLNKQETLELANALRAYNNFPEGLSNMKTQLADCFEESANQIEYGMNILCRFTEKDYEATVDVHKAEEKEAK